jgi:hypothetical protein
MLGGLHISQATQPPTGPIPPPIEVPDAMALSEAEKVVREVFKADYVKKKSFDQINLARKLLKAADETKDDPAARFVMYREARDLAARAGDVALALDAVTATSRVFMVDPIQMKFATLEAAEKASAPGKAVLDAALAATEDAIQADDYATAERYLKLAAGAAARARVAALSATVAARTKEVEACKTAFEDLAQDRKLLAKNPNDQIAASRVGRFLCLLKGDWEAGLPLLAKGSEERLKAAAEKDLTQPVLAAKQAEVGDMWWDLAEGLDPDERTGAKIRAYQWYKMAAPLLSGLTKVRVDKRMAEVAKAAEQKVARTAGAGGEGWKVIFRSDDPAIWNTEANSGPDQFAIPLNRAPAGVKYLKMTDATTRQFVVIEMTRERLGSRTEQDGYGWNGTGLLTYNGHHLGIYNLDWGRVTGKVGIHFNIAARVDYRGWGFGHRTLVDDRQGYSWAGEPTDRTVFEIAVKSAALTPDEAKRLLKKKR